MKEMITRDNRFRASRRDYLKSIGAVGATAVAGLSGCLEGDGGGEKTGATTGTSGDNLPDTLTLSGTMPLTGALSSTGKAIRTGYRSAVRKINDMGGAPIGDSTVELELNLKDDASDPDRATTIYQEFVTQDDADFLLGSFSSGIVLPTASIAEKNDKVMVQAGGGSDEIFTQGWENIYGIYPRASRQMRPTVDYFDSLEPRPETFSVITENDAYSKSLSSGVRSLLEDRNFEIINNHGVPENANDVSSVVSQVKSEDPDGLFVAGHGGVGQQVAKEVNTREVNLDVFYEVLGPWQPSYLESVGKAGNYVHTITYYSPNMENVGGPVFSSAEKFATYTRENINDVPTPFNHQIASGAAAIVSYYHALKNAGELGVEPVSTALEELSVDSFYGEIEFTSDGDGHPTKMGPMVAQIQDQEHEIVYPYEVGSAEPVYPIPPWSDR